MSDEPKPECQAFASGREAIDDMGLFCGEHWDMVPADARALLNNLFDQDYKSEKHKKWQREVRKCVALMMAKEKGLKRNVEGRNLDEFDRPDPFVREGEQKAAARGKVLGPQESDPGIISNEGTETEDDT